MPASTKNNQAKRQAPKPTSRIRSPSPGISVKQPSRPASPSRRITRSQTINTTSPIRADDDWVLKSPQTSSEPVDSPKPAIPSTQSEKPEVSAAVPQRPPPPKDDLPSQFLVTNIPVSKANAISERTPAKRQSLPGAWQDGDEDEAVRAPRHIPHIPFPQSQPWKPTSEADSEDGESDQNDEDDKANDMDERGHAYTKQQSERRASASQLNGYANSASSAPRATASASTQAAPGKPTYAALEQEITRLRVLNDQLHISLRHLGAEYKGFLDQELVKSKVSKTDDIKSSEEYRVYMLFAKAHPKQFTRFQAQLERERKAKREVHDAEMKECETLIKEATERKARALEKAKGEGIL